MNTHQYIGQSSLVKHLDSIISSGRIVHAYLFAGPSGIGKKTWSGLLARALLCENSGDKPCGFCPSCRQATSGNNPDIKMICPEEGKTGILVSQIRELQGDIIIKPYKSPRKVYIIDKAHTMNEQAQNALLKTLEEPPGYAHIMLLADNVNSLRPTILSRCQLLRLRRMSREDVASIIMERHPLPHTEAMAYASLSQGIPGRGLALASGSDLKIKRDQILEVLQRSNGSELPNLWKIFSDSREMAEDLLDVMLLWFRDILVCKETGDGGLVANMDRISYLKAQTGLFTIPALQDIIEIIEKSRRILRGNGNYQLTIENMLLRIQGGLECSS
jgi:DNA polymerase-3 subunit delta'